MRKYIITLIFLITLFSDDSLVFSQVKQEWMRSFGTSTSGIDISKFIAVDDSGNVIVAGISETSVSNRGEISVIKYNSQGDSLWSSIFEEEGSYNSDHCNGLAIDEEQNIIITGGTHKPPTQDQNIYITTIKYNHQTGERIFLNRLPNPDPNCSDRGYGITTDKSSSIFVTGTYWGGAGYNGGTGYDMVVLSYSPNGEGGMVYHWQDAFPSNGTSIAVDKNGSVYALGFASPKLRLVTLNGGITDYDLPNTDWGMASYPKMIIDRNSNPIVITQFMGNASYLDNKLMLLKFPGPQWTTVINSDNYTNSVFYDIDVDSSNNIIIAGGFQLADGKYKNFIKKFTENGDSLWTVFPPSVTSKTACSVAIDKQNSIYLTGNLSGIIAIKYNQNGEEVWRAGEGIYFTESDIFVDNSFNVYLTGEKSDLHGLFCTIKYSQNITSVNQETTPLNNFKLYQNYPNPFNPSTNIQYAIGSRQFVQLKVYDVLGREVATLVDEYKPAGSYDVELNVAQLSRAEIASGVYFYQLRIIGPEMNSGQEFIQTIKMIYLK